MTGGDGEAVYGEGGFGDTWRPYKDYTEVG